MSPPTKADWLDPKGVIAGQRTIRVVPVVGYNCYDVMVDGECAKRIYHGGEAEAIRRAENARQLYSTERVNSAVCSYCRRTIGTDRKNRIVPHNVQEFSAGRIGEKCLGSKKSVGRP